jgi:hypothetical protein
MVADQHFFVVSMKLVSPVAENLWFVHWLMNLLLGAICNYVAGESLGPQLDRGHCLMHPLMASTTKEVDFHLPQFAAHLLAYYVCLVAPT